MLNIGKINLGEMDVNVLFLMLLTFLGYILVYNVYGRFLGRKIFQLLAWLSKESSN